MTHSPSRRTARAASAALGLVLAVLLAGCGTDETTTSTETDSPAVSGTDDAGRQVIDITVEGDSVTPSGARVEVTAGEEFVLRIDADAPGELHVHSTPEQELPYESGTTDLPLQIDRPGVVEVESHELDLVIVQLEVH